jgi:hypothetical protein
MKLRLKEDPKEWRKSVLLTVVGLAVISSVLRWRGVLLGSTWACVLAVAAITAGLCWLRPRWFRGYYRFSLRVGFAVSQVIGRVVLFLIFLLLVTPLALVFRIAGKDALGLKRRKGVKSYWNTARPLTPLDRMF